MWTRSGIGRVFFFVCLAKIITMPVPTGYTIEQYDALCAAIASGTKSVEYADKKVTYQNLSDMLAAKHLMAVDLGLTGEDPSNTNRGGRRVGYFCK